MKIAYLSYSVIPSRQANSMHVMRMCRSFARLGHDVTLFAPTRTKEVEHTTTDPFEYYGVEKNFKLIRSTWHDVSKMLYPLHVASLLLKGRFDLVYGRFVPSCYLALLAGNRVVYELHSSFPKGSAYDRLLRWMVSYRNLVSIVVISEALKKHVVHAYGYPAEQVFVAHDGADMVTEVEPITLTPKDCLHVGYVGQLYKGRGLELILELAQRIPDIQFHIVGGMQPDVDAWQLKTENVPNILFHGFVQPGATASFMKAFDIVLAPYQKSVSTGSGDDTARWMSPLKVFEYMASGTAMIVSDMPVLREVLTHGQNALLCAPDSPDQWVAAINELRDKRHRHQLAQQAITDFEQHYTWDSRARNILYSIEHRP
jgi:glycosyltransferase involved in cell wall biosynthesis